jgi:hypothetical protein
MVTGELRYPSANVPAPGEMLEVAPGVRCQQMPLRWQAAMVCTHALTNSSTAMNDRWLVGSFARGADRAEARAE